MKLVRRIIERACPKHGRWVFAEGAVGEHAADKFTRLHAGCKTPAGFSVPQRKNLLWIAVDLDGTLAQPIWTPDNPTSDIGDPIRLNVTKAREAARAGWKIVIHTARPWSDYEVIEAWLVAHEIPFRAIQCGKLLAALYVDDRGRHDSASSWIPA